MADFGIKGSLMQAPDSVLERLLGQIGRNDPIGAPKRQEAQNVESILAERKKSGVSYCDQGFLHYRV